MFKMLVLALAISFVSADLIGYNRLGNDILNHNRMRNMPTESSSAGQIYSFLISQNDNSSTGQKRVWMERFRKIQGGTANIHSKRFNRYRQTMLAH